MDVEMMIVGIWCYVFGCEDLSMEDNFFDFGGYFFFVV